MCVVSMIGDYYTDKFKPNLMQDYTSHPYLHNIVRRYEFEDLKKQVQDMRDLLEKALQYDKDNNEPECHNDQKLKALKDFAKVFGIDLPEGI